MVSPTNSNNNNFNNTATNVVNSENVDTFYNFDDGDKKATIEEYTKFVESIKGNADISFEQIKQSFNDWSNGEDFIDMDIFVKEFKSAELDDDKEDKEDEDKEDKEAKKDKEAK